MWLQQEEAILNIRIIKSYPKEVKYLIKAVLGMLARGTEARKYGPMAEEAGSACDCKTKH